MLWSAALPTGPSWLGTATEHVQKRALQGVKIVILRFHHHGTVDVWVPCAVYPHVAMG